MASKTGVARAIQQLRSGGCYSSHLDEPGAKLELVVDWHAAFADLTDTQLANAASSWLESEEGRKWPTKFDLREALKSASAGRHPRTFEGCLACDFTGMRELVRIDPDDERVRFTAPCDCPKGYHLSHPPPRPPNDPLDWPPLEPFQVIVTAWERQGYEVLVATANEPHFPLEVLDTSERTRKRLEEARRATGPVSEMVAKLVDKMRMDEP